MIITIIINCIIFLVGRLKIGHRATNLETGSHMKSLVSFIDVVENYQRTQLVAEGDGGGEDARTI